MGRGSFQGKNIQRGQKRRSKTITVKGTFDRDFEVIPGVIDDSARDAFMSGQCHALAYEVHKRTGWEIAGAVDFEKDTFHLFNITPDGKAVDILGVYDYDKYYQADHLNGDAIGFRRRIKPEVIEAMGPETDWVKPDFKAASLFADALISMKNG